MAGSLVGLPYQKDDGSFYAITRDESNARASVIDQNGNQATPLFLPPATPFVGTLAPKGFKERYINASLSTDVRVRRVFPVGNPLALRVASLPGSRILASRYTSEVSQAWIVNSIRGEKGARNVNLIADTGQDDGTPNPGVT